MSRVSKSSKRLDDSPTGTVKATDRGLNWAPLELEDQGRSVHENLQHEHSVDLVASSLEAHWSSSPIRRDAPSAFSFPVLGSTTQAEADHSVDHKASPVPEALPTLLPETQQHSAQEAECSPGEEHAEDPSRTLTYPALPWGQRTRTRKAGSASIRLVTSLIDTADKTKYHGQESRSLRVQQKDDQSLVKRLRASSTTSSEGSSRFKTSFQTRESREPSADTISNTLKRTSQMSVLKNEVHHGRQQPKNSTSSDDDVYDPRENTGRGSRPKRSQKRSDSRPSGKQERSSRTLRKRTNTAHQLICESGISSDEQGKKLQSHPHRAGSEWFECVLIPRWEGGLAKSQREHPAQERSALRETAGANDLPEPPRTEETHLKRSRRIATKNSTVRATDPPTKRSGRIASKNSAVRATDPPIKRASERTTGNSAVSSKKLVVSTSHAKTTTGSPVKVFHGWWIQAKPCREKVSGCDVWIGVHGNVLKPKAMVWHTSFIKDAVDPSTVMTLTGSLYHLRGALDEERMRSNGFPQDIVEAFREGFPDAWRSILLDHFQPSGSSVERLDTPLDENLLDKSQAPHVDPVDQTGTPKPPLDSPPGSLSSPLKRKSAQEVDTDADAGEAMESLSGQVKKPRTRTEENEKGQVPPAHDHSRLLTGSTHVPDFTAQADREDRVIPVENPRGVKVLTKAPLVEDHVKDDASVVDLRPSCVPQPQTRKAPVPLNLSLRGAKLDSLLANDRPSSLSPTLQLCTKIVMEQLLHSTQGSRSSQGAGSEALNNCSSAVEPKREVQEQGSSMELALRDLTHTDRDESACAPAQVGTIVDMEGEPPLDDTLTLSSCRDGQAIFDSLQEQEQDPSEPAAALQDEDIWQDISMRHLQTDRIGQEFSTSEDEGENETMFMISTTEPSTRDSYGGSITGIMADSHPPSSPFKSLSSISAASQSTVLDFVGQSEVTEGLDQIPEAAPESLATGVLAHSDPEAASTHNMALETTILYSSDALGANSIGSLGIFGSDLATSLVSGSSVTVAATTAARTRTDASSKDNSRKSDAYQSWMGSPEATLNALTVEQEAFP
ncbi:unnamed protein product [Mortierella alpina]